MTLTRIAYRIVGSVVMQNIDHFFDTCDQLLPGWFADALITAMIIVPLIWIVT